MHPRGARRFSARCLSRRRARGLWSPVADRSRISHCGGSAQTSAPGISRGRRHPAGRGFPAARTPRLGRHGGVLYMPHLFFVAQHGLEHFEESMRAQHALTQRFTAEYSIRAFLEKHPQARWHGCASGRAIRASTCAGWSPRARGRGCPGRRGCAPFRRTRGRSSSCSSCSRTIRRCTCAARWPTTSTTSARTIRNCWPRSRNAG